MVTIFVKMLEGKLILCIDLDVFLKERETIYNTFILLHFNYCPTFWHFDGKTSIRKIELIQEICFKISPELSKEHIS